MNKLPIMITTDSVCDLPRNLAREYQIEILPYFVETDHGRFLDQTEIGGPDLVDYMRRGNFARSSRPNVEEYRIFFRKQLENASQIIHIAMGRGSSNGYANATVAADDMDHVTVFDSGHLSSSMGMVAIRAAELARLGQSAEEIIAYLADYKKKVSSRFLINDIEYLYRAKRMPRSVRNLSYRFMFRPIFGMKKGTISPMGIVFGGWKHAVKKYIAKVLKHATNVDLQRVFVTHVNLNQDSLESIAEEILKYQKFREIIFIDATAAISCNCGSGTIGVLYAKKMPLPEGKEDTVALDDQFSQEELNALFSGQSEQPQEQPDEQPLKPEKRELLDRLDFLDWHMGMLFVADNVDLYVEILKEFIHDDRETRLNGFLQNEQWEDYRILVHSLKSASRTIGIEDLSEEARLLEFACKDQNYDYVKENHPAVMEHFRQYCNKISSVVD